MRFHTHALPSAVLMSTLALPEATGFGLFHPSKSHAFKVVPSSTRPQQSVSSPTATGILLSTSTTAKGSSLINGSRHEDAHAPPIVNPATRDFNCELNRLARSDAKGSAQEAESMLLSALDKVKRGDDDTDVFPNVVSLHPTLVMTSCAPRGVVVVVNVRGTRGDHLLSAWFCLSLAVTGTDALAS